MKVRTVLRAMAVATVLAVLAALLPQMASAAPSGASGRYLVVARSSADYGALRAKAVNAGARVLRDLPQLKAMVVRAPAGARTSLAADRRTLGVATDRVRKVTVDDQRAPNLSAPGLQSAQRVRVAGAATATAAAGIRPDPAFSYRGLLWDYRRIGLPKGWRETAGSPRVTVAVADTGLDYTHAELAPKVKAVHDLTVLEDPPLCETLFGVSDQDLAADTGGPVDGDFYGHGSWIGGNIAAALDGQGLNGIAPKVGLVSLKIAQWCGFAYDTTMLAAFALAADTGVDIVNISFGGYLDRSDPEQELIYQAYVDTVAYARSKGTAIVAAAGNEHLRIGAGGRVLSHGPLTAPGAAFTDLFGQYEVPGGIPGVVDVSATGNVVNAPSATCPAGTEGVPANPNSPTCKPAGDTHQSAGVGRRNQLAYYSNYGPRIDIAGPGGHRKFNLPAWDRGGTPGFPYTTADLTNAWDAFNITSNYATQIPCFVLTGGGFPQGECYTTIRGTSMAAPHVAAAFALMASEHPSLRKHPGRLLARAKRTANTALWNTTRPIAVGDTSAGDLTGVACESGHCHLGGPRIPNGEAYGAGLVNVANP
jgi:lantibiotic leader peptide-processing serine protease